MESEVQALLAEIETSFTQVALALSLLGTVEGCYEEVQREGGEDHNAYIEKRMARIVEIHNELQKLVGAKALRLTLQAMRLAETKFELSQQRKQEQARAKS